MIFRTYSEDRAPLTIDSVNWDMPEDKIKRMAVAYVAKNNITEWADIERLFLLGKVHA